MQLDKILFVHQGFELYGSDRSFLSFCRKQSLFDSKHMDIVLSRDGPLADILKEFYNISYLGMGRLPMYIIKKKIMFNNCFIVYFNFNNDYINILNIFYLY